jgi:DNA-binding response OmpR family regulator
MDNVGILIVDDDPASCASLRTVLSSEEWRIGVAAGGVQALQELATGSWTLVVANTATTGTTGALYSILKELAFAPPGSSGQKCARVLFVVPEAEGAQAQPVLERDQLPYTLKPFHFNDFLEKVSDLLMETDSISRPIRRVKAESPDGSGRFKRENKESADKAAQRRNTGMFANRDEYQISEEELADYERQQLEETLQKKKKKPDLGLG